MTTILVVEDEASIAEPLIENLEYEGYTVLSAADGHKGLAQALSSPVDLILLDIMLPGLNGYDVCRQLRAKKITTPIIMLTAKGQEVDKVRGLDLGADDYVTKPVGVLELLARIKAVLRRSSSTTLEEPAQTLLSFGPAVVDFARFEATMNNTSVHLSPKEFDILRLLWKEGGKAVSRSVILQEVWGYDIYPTTRTVDTHIATLRAKLEADSAQPQYLLTVHGMGYRLVIPA